MQNTGRFCSTNWEAAYGDRFIGFCRQCRQYRANLRNLIISLHTAERQFLLKPIWMSPTTTSQKCTLFFAIAILLAISFCWLFRLRLLLSWARVCVLKRFLEVLLLIFYLLGVFLFVFIVTVTSFFLFLYSIFACHSWCTACFSAITLRPSKIIYYLDFSQYIWHAYETYNL